MLVARHLRGEQGSAAVEFALVLPLLVVLLFGIVQFSLMYNRQQALHAAAREGARAASIPTTTKVAVVAAVTGALAGTSFSSPAIVSVAPDVDQPCQGRSGEPVTVTVDADNDLDVPLWKSTTIGLTGKGTFRCE
jgi:Flp pilus assembly protein TadG